MQKWQVGCPDWGRINDGLDGGKGTPVHVIQGPYYDNFLKAFVINTMDKDGELAIPRKLSSLLRGESDTSPLPPYSRSILDRNTTGLSPGAQVWFKKDIADSLRVNHITKFEVLTHEHQLENGGPFVVSIRRWNSSQYMNNIPFHHLTEENPQHGASNRRSRRVAQSKKKDAEQKKSVSQSKKKDADKEKAAAPSKDTAEGGEDDTMSEGSAVSVHSDDDFGDADNKDVAAAVAEQKKSAVQSKKKDADKEKAAAQPKKKDAEQKKAATQPKKKDADKEKAAAQPKKKDADKEKAVASSKEKVSEHIDSAVSASTKPKDSTSVCATDSTKQTEQTDSTAVAIADSGKAAEAGQQNESTAVTAADSNKAAAASPKPNVTETEATATMPLGKIDGLRMTNSEAMAWLTNAMPLPTVSVNVAAVQQNSRADNPTESKPKNPGPPSSTGAATVSLVVAAAPSASTTGRPSGGVSAARLESAAITSTPARNNTGPTRHASPFVSGGAGAGGLTITLPATEPVPVLRLFDQINCGPMWNALTSDIQVEIEKSFYYFRAFLSAFTVPGVDAAKQSKRIVICAWMGWHAYYLVYKDVVKTTDDTSLRSLWMQNPNLREDRCRALLQILVRAYCRLLRDCSPDGISSLWRSENAVFEDVGGWKPGQGRQRACKLVRECLPELGDFYELLAPTTKTNTVKEFFETRKLKYTDMITLPQFTEFKRHESGRVSQFAPAAPDSQARNEQLALAPVEDEPPADTSHQPVVATAQYPANQGDAAETHQVETTSDWPGHERAVNPEDCTI